MIKQGKFLFQKKVIVKRASMLWSIQASKKIQRRKHEENKRGLSSLIGCFVML